MLLHRLQPPRYHINIFHLTNLSRGSQAYDKELCSHSSFQGIWWSATGASSSCLQHSVKATNFCYD